MRYFWNLILFPFRAIHYLYYSVLAPFKKGDHVYIELPGYFLESRKTPMLEFLSGRDSSPLFIHVIQDLRRIAKAGYIKKVSFNVNQIHYGFAELEELCLQVQELRESGIRTVGFSQAGDLKTLYFLSCLDERYCAENSEFHVLLPSVESFFFKGALKKAGIEVENFASGKYKSFAEMFTRESYSKEARENVIHLIRSIKNQILSKIKEKTNLDLHDSIPILTGKTLLERSFFKGFLEEEDFYENRMYEDYKKPPEKETEKEPDYKPTSLSSIYFIQRKKKYKFFKKKSNRIAIVSMKGEIVEGKREEYDLKEGSIHAYPIIGLLKELRKDDSIKGVVLDIDSPGGSAYASDLIYKEILRLKSSKKVYAYMKNVSASGGYYLSVACEKIYTNPYCITGSIGTVMIRPDFSGLYKKLGITKDRIEFYPTREIFSEFGKLTRESKKFLTEEIDRVKNIFYDVVCTGRNLSRDELEERGGGRVFSGQDSFQWRLSDSTSGFVKTILDLQKELGYSEMSWDYIVPTYSVRTMMKNWKSLVQISENPIDFVLDNLPRRGMEYRSDLGKIVSKIL